MKTYFAKYLPVEGEIKKGDYGLFSNGDIKKCENPNPEMEKTLPIKKVKLFFCSTDIQVGNKVKLTYLGESIILSEETVTDIDESTIFTTASDKTYTGDIYKVIGEISPEAIWVKEGDEFDDDELEPVAYCIKHPDESIYFDDMSQILEWIKYKPNPKTHKALIEIKCPTCKQFH